MHALSSIHGICWQDKIINLEILNRAQTTSMEAMLLKVQVRWTGHVIRMEEHCMPRQMLYGELVSGKQSQGRLRKRFKESLKENLKWCDMKPIQLESEAMKRASWHSLSRRAAIKFEEE